VNVKEHIKIIKNPGHDPSKYNKSK